MITFEYVQFVRSTARYRIGEGKTRWERLFYVSGGLAREASEVAELVLKAWFKRQPVDRYALVDELGDVTWYFVALLDEFNFFPPARTPGWNYWLKQILLANRDKLTVRGMKK